MALIFSSHSNVKVKDKQSTQKKNDIAQCKVFHSAYLIVFGSPFSLVKFSSYVNVQLSNAYTKHLFLIIQDYSSFLSYTPKFHFNSRSRVFNPTSFSNQFSTKTQSFIKKYVHITYKHA